MNRASRPSARPRFAGWRTIALFVSGALLFSEACAGLLGIDDPEVVGGDGGVGAGDATVDVRADAPGERDSNPPGDAHPEDGGADSGAEPSIDAAVALPPSCADAGPGVQGVNNCTPDPNCCASPLVTGGFFYRDFDYDGHGDMDSGATVSDFALDEYEVTVGRFRPFVAALQNPHPWQPDAGSGKHTHLDGGLVMPLDDGGVVGESGWLIEWTANLQDIVSGQPFQGCPAGTMTWTQQAAGSENDPINCVTWYEAYAFCIWDHGFLPSEAELNYAASGGELQRVYPWSSDPDSISCLDANYGPYKDGGGACTDAAPAPAAVGSHPAGQGLWGQHDLSGNIYEWAVDSYDLNLLSPCVNCANLTPSPDASVVRGGSYFNPAYVMYAASARYGAGPLTARAGNYGVRCARSP
jgi:formylglycine-generating enzyme required for sulfatase activity